jgi:hypothetical protein
MSTGHLREGQRNSREVLGNPGNDTVNQGNLQEISQNLQACKTKTHIKHQKLRKVATSFRQLL